MPGSYRRDHRTEKTEFTAAEEVSAKGNRKDGVHFQVQSDIVGVCGVDTAGSHDSGDTCQNTADHICKEFDQCGIQTHKAGCFSIDTDALDIESQRCLFQDQGYDHHGDDREEHRSRNRDFSDISSCHLVGIHTDIGDLSVCYKLGDTAACSVKDQGCNHGLDPKFRYQETVKRAAERSSQKSRDHCDNEGILVFCNRNLSAGKDLAAYSGSYPP